MTVVTPLPRGIRAVHDDRTSFRAAFRHLAGGVAVVTTGRGADRTGLTATSVSSLSADPPSIFFGLNRASSTYPALKRFGGFGVNFLSAGQRPVADRFAGRDGEKGAARYAGAEWTSGVSGAPLLLGALAALDCELEELIERHSHAIVIGRVREVRLGGAEPALVYWRGDYHGLERPGEEATRGGGLNPY